MHLFDDMCIVENVDDDEAPFPLARSGRACSSRTSSTVSQPLIRFEIADMVALDPEPCPCGRALMRCGRSRAAQRTCSTAAASPFTRCSSRS